MYYIKGENYLKTVIKYEVAYIEKSYFLLITKQLAI